VRRAVERGIILVAAAGNDAQLGNPTNTPANCPGVVAVGAIDVNGNPWSGSERGSYVSLAGPGVHMIGYDAQAASGYGYATGTSDAAAIVSGIFAVVRSHFPTMPARDVVTRVLYTARQLQGTPHTHNDATGYGIARPYHALKDPVPGNAPNPIYDALAATPASPTTGSTPTGDSSAGPATSPVGSVPSQAPHTVTQPGASSGGLGTGALVAIIAAVVVIVLIAIVVLLRRRQRPAHPAPPDNDFAPPRV
jgi:subtilisin family serine protease